MTDNTFTRVDLAQFDGITDGPWEVGRPNAGPVSGTIPVHTPGYDNDGYRDGALVCSVYGTATRSAANSRAIASVPRFIAALRAAYAEIDRLLASALTWTTVTDDPTTLPAVGRRVIVEHRNSGMTFAAQIDGPDLWALGSFDGERDTYAILSPGDRWAYIPEAPHADN